tara:strand:+ start:157 stop:447 length:291 start_codon:yes stop_codon:yes gene_type:complete
MKTSIQHKNVVGAVVFYQLANRTASDGNAAAINYKQLKVPDQATIHYYHDSFAIKSDSMYLEYGGRRYKQSDIPIENKNIASYILAQNSVGDVFHR